MIVTKCQFFGTLFSCILLLNAAGCRRSPQQADESQPLVKTAVAKAENSGTVLSYNGKVISAGESSVSFRIAGPVASVSVSPGDRVRKGDLLARLESRDYELQLQATTAEYEGIRREAERVIELYNRGSLPASDYDKARFGLQQITAKYEAHRNALEDTRLTAPFDGYVREVHFSEKEIVAAGMPVVTLVRDGKPGVEINVSAADRAAVSRMTEGVCLSRTDRVREYRLVPENISPSANLNGLFPMRLTFEDTEDILPAPGSQVTVRLKIESADTPGRIAVPVTALFEHEGLTCVWVMDASRRLELRTVSPEEIRRDGTVILSDGVKDGETVVTAGSRGLRSGVRVRPMPASSPTNIGNLL